MSNQRLGVREDLEVRAREESEVGAREDQERDIRV